MWWEDPPPATPVAPAATPATSSTPALAPVPITINKSAPALGKKPEEKAAPSAAKETRATSDHASVVRRLGLGFIGVSELPIADAEPVGTADAPGLAPNDFVIVRRVIAPTLGAVPSVCLSGSPAKRGRSRDPDNPATRLLRRD